jgi:hypothetical protein
MEGPKVPEKPTQPEEIKELEQQLVSLINEARANTDHLAPDKVAELAASPEGRTKLSRISDSIKGSVAVLLVGVGIEAQPIIKFMDDGHVPPEIIKMLTDGLPLLGILGLAFLVIERVKSRLEK